MILKSIMRKIHDYFVSLTFLFRFSIEHVYDLDLWAAKYTWRLIENSTSIQKMTRVRLL